MEKREFNHSDKSQHCELPCKQHRQEITSNHLPLSCPMPEECLWNAHPRVYLHPDENGQALCPYCSRQFVLAEKTDQT
ncbi:MAG TPA: zinc-finger domain-containing protein [Chromatiaceae bacterium]|nr:zinc-finger domain-containing protein [Chromatiaceae bacterium]